MYYLCYSVFQFCYFYSRKTLKVSNLFVWFQLEALVNNDAKEAEIQVLFLSFFFL